MVQIESEKRRSVDFSSPIVASSAQSFRPKRHPELVSGSIARR
jgi:hypothetical protein